MSKEVSLCLLSLKTGRDRGVVASTKDNSWQGKHHHEQEQNQYWSPESSVGAWLTLHAHLSSEIVLFVFVHCTVLAAEALFAALGAADGELALATIGKLVAAIEAADARAKVYLGSHLICAVMLLKSLSLKIIEKNLNSSLLLLGHFFINRVMCWYTALSRVVVLSLVFLHASECWLVVLGWLSGVPHLDKPLLQGLLAENRRRILFFVLLALKVSQGTLFAPTHLVLVVDVQENPDWLLVEFCGSWALLVHAHLVLLDGGWGLLVDGVGIDARLASDCTIPTVCTLVVNWLVAIEPLKFHLASLTGTKGLKVLGEGWLVDVSLWVNWGLLVEVELFSLHFVCCDYFTMKI